MEVEIKRLRVTQRYLDTKTSRWMSADPIYDGLKEGFGIYTYCRNNPLIYHDPTGLAAQGYDPNGNKYVKPQKYTRDAKNYQSGIQNSANYSTPKSAIKTNNIDTAKYGPNAKIVDGRTMVSQNDLTDGLDGKIDGNINSNWGWMLYTLKDGTEIKISTLCVITSLMGQQDLNTNTDVGIQPKLDFLAELPGLKDSNGNLILKDGEVKNPLALVQNYANSVGSTAPIGICPDSVDGILGRFSSGRNTANTHSCIFNTSTNKMYFNTWTTTTFGDGDKYENKFQFIYPK